MELSFGKLASAKGFANENRLLAALLERGYNASRVEQRARICFRILRSEFVMRGIS